jgi:cellulose synthase/poly-beta-1,6-N-acetylglucosamine synthase-like glycosyltransferase
MVTLTCYVLMGITVILALPCAIFSIEIFVSIFSLNRALPAIGSGRRGRVAVLIPAHDEAGGIATTLDDIKVQLRATDRVLVVADNCSDDTATIAASSGAEVTVRSDPARIGKGYALDWGLNHLAAAPPDIVIMVDADCRVMAGTIDRLARLCEATQRPAQSLYLMKAAGSAINHQVAEFAWRIKNWVRPSGLNALGLPSQLMGTGMAFPWTVIRAIDLSSGMIVEDLKLGLDLASSGKAPIFCPSAIVTSTFSPSVRGAAAQRKRWEYGHLAMIITTAPRLLYEAVKRRDLNLMVMVLDLMVPPLSLLGASLVVVAALGAIAASLGGSPVALQLSLVNLTVLTAATFLAWLKIGRDILPLRSFALILSYFMGKVRLYWAFLSGQRVSSWIRADRE